MKSNIKFFKNSKMLPVDKFFETVLYDKKFGYYNPKTKKAQIYDGSKRTLTNTIVNGKPGFTIPKIFEGKCSKTQFDRMLTN